MQAGDSKLGTELSRSHVYIIPHFQRPYVWDVENWQLLWDDIRSAAQAIEAEWCGEALDDPPNYFLGAIVTQQRKPSPRRLASSSIIDGQQRMATLQVLLASARHVATAHGLASVAGKLDDLVANNPKAVDLDYPQDLPKLVPLPNDQAAFSWASRDAESVLERPEAALFVSDQLCDARDWFEAVIGEWTEEAEDPGSRLEALHFAVDKRIQIVHIMLDASEDAKVIFEVLNGRGEPLSAADLIKNLLFEAGEREGASPHALLEAWHPFDSKPWRDDITTGRIRRMFIDVFLGYWLSVATLKDTLVDDLYDEFKEWLQTAGRPAIEIIRQLRADAERYIALRKLTPTTPLGALVDAMEATGTSTPWPLVLGLATRGDVPEEQLDVMATAVSSLTMRRAVCRMSTKDYNNLFLSVLKACGDAPPGTIGDLARMELAGQEADSRRWPSDSEFRAGLVDANLFNNVYRARLRALLAGLENHLLSDKSEHQNVVSAKAKLQVEHLLPQVWTTYWPVDPSVPHAATIREDAVHRLGNLTLLTPGLNKSVSHKAWKLKGPEVQRYTLLRLANSSVFAKPSIAGDGWTDVTWASDWDEERIRLRSRWLADHAVLAWPRPPGGPEVDWQKKLLSPLDDGQLLEIAPI